MEVAIQNIENIFVIGLEGSLDSQSAQEIKDVIFPLTEQGQKILLNMQAVDYMSSAGLRFLLLMYQNMNKSHGNLVLYGLSPRLMDVVEMTGFRDNFTIVDRYETGMELLQQ